MWVSRVLSARISLTFKRPWSGLHIVKRAIHDWCHPVRSRSQLVPNLSQTVSCCVIVCLPIRQLYGSFVVHFLRKVPSGIKRGLKHLGPLIRERIEQEAQYGDDWPDKPVSKNFTFCVENSTFLKERCYKLVSGSRGRSTSQTRHKELNHSYVAYELC